MRESQVEAALRSTEGLAHNPAANPSGYPHPSSGEDSRVYIYLPDQRRLVSETLSPVEGLPLGHALVRDRAIDDVLADLDLALTGDRVPVLAAGSLMEPGRPTLHLLTAASEGLELDAVPVVAVTAVNHASLVAAMASRYGAPAATLGRWEGTSLSTVVLLLDKNQVRSLVLAERSSLARPDDPYDLFLLEECPIRVPHERDERWTSALTVRAPRLWAPPDRTPRRWANVHVQNCGLRATTVDGVRDRLGTEDPAALNAALKEGSIPNLLAGRVIADLGCIPDLPELLLA